MLPPNAAMTDPVAGGDQIHAVVQLALHNAEDGPGLAHRCAATLRRQGICTLPDDWLVLERAGDRHCWEVLTEIAAAEKLSAVQSARLRLALSGRLPTVGTKKRSMIGTTESQVRLPLWHIFRRYTLFNPLEVCFIFTNRPLWYRSVFDALDGDRLRDTLCGSSELILIAAALNMGGLLTLITYDLSRSYVHQASATPLHVICLSVNLFAFLFSFTSVLFQLYTLHIYLPVHPDNLRDVVRSTRILPMTGALFFAISAWGMFLGLVFEAMRPLENLEGGWWLFREQDLNWTVRVRYATRMRAHKSPFCLALRNCDREVAPTHSCVYPIGPAAVCTGCAHLCAPCWLCNPLCPVLRANIGGRATRRPLGCTGGGTGAAPGGGLLASGRRQAIADRPGPAQCGPRQAVLAPPWFRRCTTHGERPPLAPPPPRRGPEWRRVGSYAAFVAFWCAATLFFYSRGGCDGVHADRCAC